MTTLEAIRIALQSLWANKLRSVLTLLGVVIGVAAVIAVVTFVNGINGYVAEKIFNLGADVFIISKVTPVITNVDQLLEGQKRKDLTLEDYEAVLEALPAVRHGGRSDHQDRRPREVRRAVDQRHLDSWHDALDGADSRSRSDRRPHAQRERREQPLQCGRDRHRRGGQSFPRRRSVGQGNPGRGRDLRVIGVGKKQGKTLGQSRDNYVAIPITTYLKQFGSHSSIRISGKANGVGHPTGGGDGRGPRHSAGPASRSSRQARQLRRGNQRRAF